MKPGLSVARTGVLPSRARTRRRPAKTSGAVAMVRTTSTSFISGTGLKKCRPMKRSGRPVAVISSVMESEEVFEAKIASCFSTASSGVDLPLLGEVLDDGLDDDVAVRRGPRSFDSVALEPMPGSACVGRSSCLFRPAWPGTCRCSRSPCRGTAVHLAHVTS